MGTSPIEPLLEKVARAPFEIASERAPALRKLIEKHQLMIRVLDTPEMLFETSRMLGIRTSLHSYEFLWIAAYYYTVLADVQPGAERGLFGPDPEQRKTAHQLYLKVTEMRRSGPPFVWPTDAPSPSSQDPQAARATELFSSMCGFLMLHGIALLEIGYTKDTTPPPHEARKATLEADRWAYRWILDSWDRSRLSWTKTTGRTTALLFTLTHIGAIEIRKKHQPPSYYPTVFERLRQFITDYDATLISKDSKAFWSFFQAVSLGVQMRSGSDKVEVPEVKPVSLLDYLNETESARSPEDRTNRAS